MELIRMTKKSSSQLFSSFHGDKSPFWLALIVAIVATAFFFVPFFRQGGSYAGFVFNGDAWHLIAAQLGYSRFLIHHGIFSGLDFFTHNGASEFFLRPNLPIYHPLVLLLSAIFPVASDPVNLASEYLVLLLLPALFAAFFVHRLAYRFLRFDLPISTFIAVGYVFSIQIVDSVWYLPFSMIAWTFPIVIYAGLVAGEARSLRASLIWSLPPFVAFLSGYVPLSIVAIGLAAVVVVFLSFEKIKGLNRKEVVKQIAWCWSPILLASAFVSPYYIDLFRFNRTVEVSNQSGAHSLDTVAHITGEPVQNLVHAVVRNITVSGFKYEFDLFLGLVPILIAVLFFSQNREERDAGNKNVLASVGISVFLLFALSVFGTASPLSDMFYFFAPVVGYMHLYQRYLVIAQLFLIVFLAVGLDRVVQNPPYGFIRKLAALTALGTLTLAFFVGHEIGGAFGAVSSKLVIEFVFALLFLLSFFIFSRKGVVIAATLAMFLVSLGSFYDYEQGPQNNYKSKASENITFSQPEMERLAAFFARNSNKGIVKYADLLPNPQPFIPKNLSWFMLDRVKLSSYYGYDWHLGADFSYRKLAGVTASDDGKDLLMRPDWAWLQKTGVEFVLYEEGNSGNDRAVASIVDLSDNARVFRTGPEGKIVLAPLKKQTNKTHPAFLFDNGIISVSGDDASAKVDGFKTNYANKISFQIDSKSPVVVSYLFWPNKNLHAIIDGKCVDLETRDGVSQLISTGGAHTVEIRYVDRWLVLFKVLYGLFIIAWLAACLLPKKVTPKFFSRSSGS